MNKIDIEEHRLGAMPEGYDFRAVAIGRSMETSNKQAMNNKQIEEWIYQNEFTHELGSALWVDDLRELLKTYALVPIQEQQ